MAFVSRTLATIVTNLQVDVSLEQCTLPTFNGAVKQEMQNLQFRSILNRLTFTDDQSATDEACAIQVESVEVAT
ncbi:MAG: hypothetical protein J6Q55_00530, partial [Clostridia bacterium]|nr:hypothetical protein [Clostridia bacterium]